MRTTNRRILRLPGRAILLLLLGILPILLAAQVDPGVACRPALMKDIISHMSTSQQHFSYFSQIDEETFKQFKLDIAARIGIPIPLPDAMAGILEASASYSEFSEQRRSYFESVGYTSDHAREERDVRVVTSPVAYSAWVKCIQALATEQRTLAGWKDQEDASTVHVRIVNATAVQVRLTSDLVNGSVTGQRPGKAFRDGVKLGAGGTMAVLVQRSGEGKLKLSINSRPQINAVLVESEWATPPAGQLTGNLVLTFETTEVQDRGVKRGDSWVTPDFHNTRCEHDPCSSDGKWQLSRGVLNVAAGAGRKLRNPRLECADTPRQGCEWSRGQPGPWCAVLEGSQAAQCSVLAGAGTHTETIVADEYEIVTKPLPAGPQATILFKGGQFTLNVPSTAKSAVFSYSGDFGAGALTPGDAASPDGKVVLLGQSDPGDNVLYTYRLEE